MGEHHFLWDFLYVTLLHYIYKETTCLQRLYIFLEGMVFRTCLNVVHVLFFLLLSFRKTCWKTIIFFLILVHFVLIFGFMVFHTTFNNISVIYSFLCLYSIPFKNWLHVYYLLLFSLASESADWSTFCIKHDSASYTWLNTIKIIIICFNIAHFKLLILTS